MFDSMTSLTTAPIQAAPSIDIRVHTGDSIGARLPKLEEYLNRGTRVPLTRMPGWLSVMQTAMGHAPIAIESLRGERTVGVLCLALVKSVLFGRFLVSLPYLNSSGIQADDDDAANALTDRAVALADELRVRYLELRNETVHEHPSLTHRRAGKCHMRLELPTSGAALWEQVSAKVRNQVRKGQKFGFTARWGGVEVLDEFYDVFSRNMRDLGTPTFSRSLFAAILSQFPESAELCVLRDKGRAVAGALLLHGRGVSEVPSASSLRSYNPTCANMLLYWCLLERSAERGQELFDFGRSTENSPTYRFKKQWGATSTLADWQYYLREGCIDDMRPDNPKYRFLIAVWRRLPIGLTRWIGPRIVRGIP
jgi:FemAB-related protein (PEP-CTERM system-associated)